MAKATNQLAATIPRCDVVVEVRDARAPFSSGNPLLAHLIATAANAAALRHVIVFNKADLANPQLQRRVEAAVLAGDGGGGRPAAHACLFTTATKLANLSTLLRLVDAAPSRAARFRTAGKTMVVVGAPNVGKSTLLNALRQHATSGAGQTITRRGAATGSIPGITRQVATFLVRPDPPLYMFDSPGIMVPWLDSVDQGLRLAVTAILPDHHVPWPVQAEFLLHYWHAVGSTRYTAPLKLVRAYHPDETQACLEAMAASLGLRISTAEAATRGSGWDVDAAARHLVRAFNDGTLGRYTLDTVPALPASG